MQDFRGMTLAQFEIYKANLFRRINALDTPDRAVFDHTSQVEDRLLEWCRQHPIGFDEVPDWDAILEGIQ